MTAAEQAIAFVDSHRRVRVLPLTSQLRHTLVRHYVYARNTGQTHKQAKEYATLSLDPITLMVIGWAVQIIIYLAKKWWDRRDVSTP